MLDYLFEDLDLALGDATEVTSMKILMVVDKFEVWGGLETYLVTVINYLAKLGHSVVIDCKKIDELFLAQFRGKGKIRILENKGLEEVAKFISYNSIDVIQGQTYASAARTFELYKRTKIPYVITCHGPLIEKAGLTQQIVSSASKIIAVSKEVYENFTESYPLAKNKSIIIQNPTSLAGNAVSEIASTETMTLMFLGRLDPDRRKGVELLIESYQLSGFNKLLICGDGGSKEELKRKYCTDKSIEFLGATDKPLDLILNANVVVATGRGARETLAAGRPCLVLSSWGYDGIVTPRNINKIEEANFSGRANTLAPGLEVILKDLKVLENLEIQKKLGIWGQRIIAERYDIKQIGAKLLLLYNQLRVTKNKPLVSIILPVFNQSELLGMAVESALRQTLTNFELIIINDGSTDGFMETAKKFKDQRIKILVNEKNMKLPYTLNKGLLQARGKYVTWTSADNILLPNFLAELVQALEENPDYGSIYSDYNQINSSGKVIQKMSKGVYILDAQTNFGPAFLYRKEVVERVGFFDETLFGIEDRDYSIRMAAEAPVLWLPRVLYHYRIHDNSLTGQFVNKKISFSETFKNFRKKWGHCLEFAEREKELFKKSPLNKSIKKELLFFAQSLCYGNSEYCDSGVLLIGKVDSENHISALRFNLRNIPKTAYILEAQLEMFIVRNDNQKEKELFVYPCPRKELENSFAKTTSDGSFSWVRVNVTDIVRRWVNCGIENNLLAIEAEDGADFIIANRNYQIKSLEPRLRVWLTGYVRGKELL